MSTQPLGHQKKMKMGVGEAILRLIHVELTYSNGFAKVPENLRQERDMIVSSLNQLELNLGFDCNEDGMPDTVDIFKQTVETSCCRLLPSDTSRRSRKTKATEEAVETDSVEPKAPSRRRRG